MITSTALEQKYLAEISDGTHTFLADTGVAYGGQFAGFGPVSLLEAALAGCITMMVRIAADKKNIPLDGVQVEAKLTQGKTENLFEYRIITKGDLTEEQLAVLHRAAEACPVKKIMSGTNVFKKID